MGFITNQWLMGNPERNRHFNPVQGLIKAFKAWHTWLTEERGVVLGIQLKREGGDYQTMYFTQAEIDKMFPVISGTVTQAVRLKMAQNALRDVSDAELLSFLAMLLSLRAEAIPASETKARTPSAIPPGLKTG